MSLLESSYPGDGPPDNTRSATLYRWTFEANLMPMTIFQKASLRFIEANQAACDYYGYSRERFLTLTPLDFFSKRLAEDLRPVLEDVNLPSTDFEQVHFKADGTRTAVHVYLQNIPWEGAPAVLVTIQDINERVATLALSDARADALAQSEIRYRKVFEDNPIPMLVADRSTLRYTDVNQAACAYYGYSREEFLKLGRADLYPRPTGLQRVAPKLSIQENGVTEAFDTTHLRADGTPVRVHVTIVAIPWGGAPSLLVMAQDMNEREAILVKLEESNEALRQAQRIAHVGSWSRDLRTGERSWSQETFRILGLQPEDGIPAGNPPYRALFSDEDIASMELTECQAVEDRGTHGSDHRLARPDGTIAWIHQELVAEFDDDGSAIRLLGTLHDITAQKNSEARLEQQARVDALTGLPNRKATLEAIEAMVAAGKRRNQPVALMFIDLDEFKNVNDALGHTAGDDLLKEIAARMRASLRTTDFVGRMGGDEFVIILPDAQGPSQVALVASDMRANIARPVRLQRDVVANVSVGIAMYPQDGADAETLIMNADTAMYYAKREGRARHRFFSREMHAAAEEQLRLDTALRNAIAGNDFAVWYQPIVSTRDDAIVAVEALVRWPQPDGTILEPRDFLARVEANRLIVPLGKWVLGVACANNARWNAAADSMLRVHINVCSKEIEEPGFVKNVLNTLSGANLSPNLLELELTETAAANSPEVASRVAQELRAAGIRITLDDFGTGHNSLANLRSMRIDSLKLKKRFVDEIEHNVIDAAIAAALIGAVGLLGATAIAEGVETPEQSAFLQHLGFDVMQGHLFGAPMTGDAFERFLIQSRRNATHGRTGKFAA